MSNNKHGHTKKSSVSPTYLSWRKMLVRCTDPKSNRYQYYGGRGISVCKEWFTFENFLYDMGIRPTNTSLDRIDVNGNYCKENCRWANKNVQRRNSRGNLKSTSKFKGVSWCSRYKKWRAQIAINRKPIYLGRFVDEIEAAKAYNIAAIKYFGENTFLNIIK